MVMKRISAKKFAFIYFVCVLVIGIVVLILVQFFSEFAVVESLVTKFIKPFSIFNLIMCAVIAVLHFTDKR